MRRSFKTLPHFVRFLRPYRGLLYISSVLTVVSALLSLAQPWPLAFIVDSVLGHHRPPHLITQWFGSNSDHLILIAVGAILLTTLIGGACDVFNSYVQTRVQQFMVLDVRANLFTHVERLSMSFHDRQKKGHLSFAINNQAAAIGEITVAIIPMARSVLTVVGMSIVTWRLNRVIALMSLSVMPFLYAATGFYGNHVEPRLRRVRVLEGNSLAIVYEAFAMIRVIVAFARERFESSRFVNQGRETVRARVDVTVRQTMYSIAVNVITAAGTGAVLWYGTHLVLQKRLTTGELLVVMVYIAAAYKPLSDISSTLAGLQQQAINLEAVVHILEVPPEIVDCPDPDEAAVIEGRVTMHSVDFAYPGRHKTLIDITFDVAAGSLVGIVGPTGAGKSTLVNLIPRMVEPSAGHILIDGRDINEIGLRALRRQIAVVPQEPALFFGTIADNIRYGRLDASAAEVVAAARQANAHRFILDLPQEYQTVLGERGAQLSGGERQRLAIARAFLRDAPILLLDEPTSAVDSITEGSILEALQRLMRSRTTFLIAHRLSTLRQADVIFVMDSGRIVEIGGYDELLARGDLFSAMVAAQRTDPGPEPDSAFVTPVTPDPGPVPAQLIVKRPVPRPGLPVPRSGLERAAAYGRTRPNGHCHVISPAGSHHRAMRFVTRPAVVVMGSFSASRNIGDAWHTAQYLEGLRRLGCDVTYVEAPSRVPRMLLGDRDQRAVDAAVQIIGATHERFGFDGSWALHALHADGRCYGLGKADLLRKYFTADLILNLSRQTHIQDEYRRSGVFAYVESDPAGLYRDLADGDPETIDFLGAHDACFTYASGLVFPRAGLTPTLGEMRPPTVLDWWASSVPPDAGAAIGVRVEASDDPCERLVASGLVALPEQSGLRYELEHEGLSAASVELLTARGWRLRDPQRTAENLDAYQSDVNGSLAGLSVPNDDEVTLYTGRLTERSAWHLAAGRPVVASDTGLASSLPVGRGLMHYADMDGAAAAVSSALADWDAHSRAAIEIAQEYLSAERVLSDLLEAVGLRPPRRGKVGLPRQEETETGPSTSGIPWRLDLRPVSKRPTRLVDATARMVLDRPVSSALCQAAPIARSSVNASIVVVSFENLVFTRLCLESILESTSGQYEVVVVDNGSADGSADYLTALATHFPHVQVVANESNRGFAAAANQGLQRSRGGHLLLLNNDTVVTPGWLGPLLAELADRRVGLVAPATNETDGAARAPTAYRTYGQLVEHSRKLRSSGRTIEVESLAMFCVAMRRDVFERVGPLDERFEIGLFEDDDYCMRVRTKGLALRCIQTSFVHHFGEASFGKLVPSGEYARLFAANQSRFESKWGVTWTQRTATPDPAYEELVRRVCELVDDLNGGGAVAVVTNGDARFLDVIGRRVHHLPKGPDEEWAGWHPANSGEALEQLLAAQRAGCEWLVIPAPSAWWLDHYDGLRAYLAASAVEFRRDPSCTIFDLTATRQFVASAINHDQEMS